jgi:S1-C subfamily serine protease
VITSFDGTAVSSAATLRSAIIRRHPGDTVTVVWVDQAGQQHQATVTLTSGPPL